MTMKKAMPRSGYGRLYLSAVILAGSSIAVIALRNVMLRPTWSDWVVLAALTLLTGSFTVKIPSLLARISVSDAFVFASVLLFGPSVATVITAVDSLVATFWMRPQTRSQLREEH